MECPGVNITSRYAWGAPEIPADATPLPHPAQFMVYTHTYGEPCCTFQECAEVEYEIRSFHKGPPNNFVDIVYNFLIGMDGTVFEGRGWNWKGQFQADYDNKGLITAFIENFPVSGDNYKGLTYAAAKSANALLQCALSSSVIQENYTLMVNAHQTIKDYILNPELLQPSDNGSDQTHFPTDGEAYRDAGVAAGIAFGSVTLLVLIALILFVVWNQRLADKQEAISACIYTKPLGVHVYADCRWQTISAVQELRKPRARSLQRPQSLYGNLSARLNGVKAGSFCALA